MRMRKVLNILFLLTLLTTGAWLIGRPGVLSQEDPARRQAVISALAPEGSAPGAGQPTGAATNGISYDPVEPVAVDFGAVVDTFDERDSFYERWQRGEVDLDREATIVGEAELEAMRALALQQPRDEDVQIAPSGPQPGAPQPGVSFDSIQYGAATGGSVPPDPELAAGRNHIIAIVNVAVAIYDKSGSLLYGPIHAGNLFQNTFPECEGKNLYDPNVLYDEESDRWIIAFDSLPFEASGGYCLLASQTGNPLGSWNAYFFHLNSGTTWLDFPHAGVGDSYIFMGGNMFNAAGYFVEGRIFAFNKANLYSGAPTAAAARSLGGLNTTPQPLHLHGYQSGTWPAYGNEHYFLVDPYNGKNYHVFRWNPATSALVTVGTANLGAADQTIPVPQPGAGTLESNDWRPLDFEYRNGYGWTTMTISCEPGSGPVNCIRWAQINLVNASLGPAGSGTYASNGVHRFFPDLAVNRCNDVAVGYTKSSSAVYPGIWVTGREHSDPAGLLQGEVQLKGGERSYHSFATDPAPYRWGDYTGMTIDPDGERFWYLGEYSKNIAADANWGTYIGSFSYPGCTLQVPSRALVLSLITKLTPPGPRPGLWRSNSVAMQFYVTADGDHVGEFTVWINVPTCNLYNYKVTHTSTALINNNTFAFSGSFYASGTFNSTTSASGQLGLNSYVIDGCGPVGTNGAAAWSAVYSPTQLAESSSAGAAPPDDVKAITAVQLEP